MFNDDVRRKVADCTFKAYEIARELGMSEAAFFDMLNAPMSDWRKKAVFDAIQRLEQGEQREES